LKLDGEIVQGDLARFETIAKIEFRGVEDESSSKDTICLNSPGGSVLEGVLLAEEFYKRGVGTVIDDGAECYSICAIIFMMGIAQGPEVNFVNRRLHFRGKLGFHRPYLALNSDELISAQALPVAHDMAMESIMKIMILANNHVPWSNSTMIRPDLIQLMLTHIGSDLYYIDTVEKAGRFEIDVVGFDPPKSLNEEQAYYACENSFHWQVALVGKNTDYQSFLKNTAGQKISTLLEGTKVAKIFKVISEDAGYSEAGCLIGFKEGNLYACGYDGEFNVSIGQNECAERDFFDKSGIVPLLTVFKPSLELSQLGNDFTSKSTIGEKTTATCVVITPSNEIEKEPCLGVISNNIYRGGRRADRYEFVWPTGNKTIILRDGDTFSVNGKPALPEINENYTFCVINTQSKNRFCFKLS
jgi:hypothetical protein